MYSQARKITALKGHLSRTINELRNALADDNIEKADILEMQETLYDRRDVLVNEIYTLLESLDEQEEEDQKKRREDEIQTIDERIDEVSKEVTNFLKGFCFRLIKDSKNGDSEAQVERLALPKFSGKEYFQWRALFDSLIDKKNWPNQTKMIRLLSCVEGEARELIKNFPPTDEAYKESLTRLDEVYGGQRRRIAEVLRKVRQGRIVQEEDHFEILRFTSILQAARVALGEKNDEVAKGSALYENALDRLSSSLLRNYRAWIMDKEKSECLNSLITFLSRWSKIIETNPDTNVRKPRTPNNMFMHTQTFNKEKDNCDKRNNNNNFILKCVCHLKVKSTTEHYYLDKCTEFKNLPVKKRREFIYSNKLCKICFKPNHMARTCRNLRTL